MKQQTRKGNPPHALTIDLEDWYHGLTRTNVKPQDWPHLVRRAQESTPLLLDILDEADVHATFFVLGDLVRENPSLIKRIAQKGHELGCHGYSHRPVHSLTPATFRQELDKTRKLIEDVAGKSVIGFRAPYFSIDHRCLWAFKILEEAGFQYDSSVFPIKTILYGYVGASRLPYNPIDGSDFMEYPVATIRLLGLTFPVAGGFYFRILPYSIIHWALTKLKDNCVSAILYMHPWELDCKQPRIPVSPRERFTHFTGRSTLAEKIERLCRDFDLTPLGEIHRLWITNSNI